MNRRIALLIGAALVPALGALSGCTEHISASSGHGTFVIEGTVVRIRVPGDSTAYVHASGRLVIGRRAIALRPPEQTLAQQYYRHALGISAAGAAAGKAGGRLGAHIVGSLFAALWQSNASVIDRTAHRGAVQVRTNVRSLCRQMAQLATTQNALAAAVPAFAPYRIIRRSDVEECIDGATRHARANR